MLSASLLRCEQRAASVEVRSLHHEQAKPVSSTAMPVKRLRSGDLAHLIRLQALANPALPTGFVRTRSDSDLQGFLNGRLGAAYGIDDGSELLAMALLRIPNADAGNTGAPFPLVPAEDWPLHACFLENTLVMPQARGRGFQRALVAARITHATAASMKWVCAGVHLDNVASWRNLLRAGLVIAGIRADFGYPVLGLLRSLETPWPRVQSNAGVWVPVQDAALHEAMLQEGHVGIELTDDGGVIYRRLHMDGGHPA